ncbi:allantoate amidohydrolase [Bordetella genomosp. 5]|nr:allantoate amidohydrolase [Bordetella genomosp. 5]
MSAFCTQFLCIEIKWKQVHSSTLAAMPPDDLRDSGSLPAQHPAGASVMEWADTLAQHTDVPGQLTCTYLTEAHRATADQLARWMREAGFDTVRVDAVGNVIGRYRADARVAEPRLVATGSHYDTVRNGGRYDGRLGILLPVAVVAALHAAGERLPYDLEVIGFAEEEGVRYGSTFLGSSAYLGQFDMALLDQADAKGIPMRDALRTAGLDPDAIAQAAADRTRLAHFFEVHIEQGPVLLQRELPLGIVSAIAGCVRRRLVLTGQAGHAGTTPMGMRRDAACAAAEIVLMVENRCRSEDGLVGTVGVLDVPGGSINVIPGACVLTLDVRAGDDAVRDQALADIEREIAAICARRAIEWHSEELMRAAATPCTPAHRAHWRAVLESLHAPVFELPSGAGHDAMLMGRAVPTSMLFVRCGNGGISHNPLETMTAEDAALAARAVTGFLHRLAQD